MMSYRAPLIAGFVFLVPAIALAQLFPTQLVPCNGPECEACHVVALAQNIINFLVAVAVLIAVGMFAYAGVLMVTAGGDTGKIGRARGIFTDVAVGFIILLAAWLIVDTVMKMLYEGSALDSSTRSDFGPWNEIQCVGQPLPVPGTGGATSTPTGGVSTEGTTSHMEALAKLQAAGINVVSTGGCSDKTKSNCTSLDGMQEDTINQILAIKQACPTCEITVTGGTETGHSGGAMSHGTGYKVDINDTASANSFFESNLSPAGSRSGDPRYLDSCGNEYVRESDHWDITVSNGSCSL